jgi:hypothetical protein
LFVNRQPDVPANGRASSVEESRQHDRQPRQHRYRGHDRELREHEAGDAERDIADPYSPQPAKTSSTVPTDGVIEAIHWLIILIINNSKMSHYPRWPMGEDQRNCIEFQP